MAQQLIAPNLGINNVDTTAQVALGTVYEDEFGSEFAYLQGIGSTVVGSAATYASTFVTTLLLANAIGPVAFAMAAILANQFGWYCTKNVVGTCPARSNGNVANNAALYGTAGAGNIDDAAVAGDLLLGAFATSAATGAVAFTVRCTYPLVTDTLS